MKILVPKRVRKITKARINPGPPAQHAPVFRWHQAQFLLIFLTLPSGMTDRQAVHATPRHVCRM